MEWSREVAYLTGLFCADAHIYRGINYGVHTTKDKQLADLVISLLDDYAVRESGSVYCIAFRANDFAELGIPRGAKYDKLTWPEMPSCYNRDFIRGFFDGDGTAGGNGLAFYSCSLDLLLAMEHIFSALGCYANNPKWSGTCYSLGYYNVVDVGLITMYMYLYPTTDMCLFRKRDRLFKKLGVGRIPATPNLIYPSRERSLCRES